MWAQLPYDIINEIANNLDAVEDFLAFSFVCKSWRLIYRDKAWLSIPKIPWLMLDNHENGEHCFSIYKHKILKIPIPKAQNRRIWGSSHGWLIMITPDFKVQLFNPITQVKAALPPVSAFFEKLANVKVDWFYLIHKASVLKLGTQFLVVVIYGPRNSLAYSKLGEVTWTFVESQLIFTSVVSYKGKVLGLSAIGTLAIIEIDDRKKPSVSGFVSPPVLETGWKRLYLAESCDDLLLVCFQAKKVFIYRLDLLVWEWKKMDSLGNRVLFVDEYNCISASSCTEAAYFKGDCIYYSKDNVDSLCSGDVNEVRNYISVYDMRRNIYVRMLLVDNRCFSRYICPVWLIPSLW